MFKHTSSRPPVVPVEETESFVDTQHLNFKSRNPALTPRTSSLHQHSSSQDGLFAVPHCYEPHTSYVDGRAESPYFSDGSRSLPPSSSSPPAYLKWARHLSELLDDPTGVQLFRKYLAAEGKSHSDALDFWFACEGLHKMTDPDRIAQIVKAIYKRFFLKTQLGISDPTRKAIHKRLKDPSLLLDSRIFDSAQAQIEQLINETTYPNFLKSDLYISHVQSMQNGFVGSGAFFSDEDSPAGEHRATAMLETLHEDQALETTTAPVAPLTKEMLFYTQRRRAVEGVTSSEAFTGIYPSGKGAIRAYSSYNPVSRIDSELQSLNSSSDARTESDNMSLTDGSSVDGMSFGGGPSVGHNKMTRKHYHRFYRQAKESASLNRDPSCHHTVIPRTQRIQKEQIHPVEPERFAKILIEKLEIVKRNQEAQEKLAHKLFSTEDGVGLSAKALADAIKERFQIDDDNDQDILDQHVSRVWSDLTPSRTPGLVSPRPKSPEMLRRNGRTAQASSLKVGSSLPPYSGRPYSTRHPRRDRDAFSTFSSDSGNVHDFPPSGSELHLPKSKSMPDYDSTDVYSSVASHDGRVRGGSGRRVNRKPEFTDSGVSVVSESLSIDSQSNKDKVRSWLNERDRSSCCSHTDRGDSERASSCSSSSRYDGKHHARPNPVRGRRSPPSGPAQPFVADPNMPPMPSPNTPAQLEEARRRLEEQARCKQARQQRCCPPPPSSASKEGGSASAGSTLKKAKPEGPVTTVVYSMCDEPFPYLTKIPGLSVTLRQFKESLPKKGNYRYFFKTECEYSDMRVILEEITDDNEVLPLWEGKVMAHVKPIE